MRTLSGLFTCHTEHVYRKCLVGNTSVPPINGVTQWNSIPFVQHSTFPAVYWFAKYQVKENWPLLQTWLLVKFEKHQICSVIIALKLVTYFSELWTFQKTAGAFINGAWFLRYYNWVRQKPGTGQFSCASWTWEVFTMIYVWEIPDVYTVLEIYYMVFILFLKSTIKTWSMLYIMFDLTLTVT